MRKGKNERWKSQANQQTLNISEKQTKNRKRQKFQKDKPGPNDGIHWLMVIERRHPYERNWRERTKMDIFAKDRSERHKDIRDKKYEMKDKPGQDCREKDILQRRGQTNKNKKGFIKRPHFDRKCPCFWKDR